MGGSDRPTPTRIPPTTVVDSLLQRRSKKKIGGGNNMRTAHGERARKGLALRSARGGTGGGSGDRSTEWFHLLLSFVPSDNCCEGFLCFW